LAPGLRRRRPLYNSIYATDTIYLLQNTLLYKGGALELFFTQESESSLAKLNLHKGGALAKECFERLDASLERILLREPGLS